MNIVDFYKSLKKGKNDNKLNALYENPKPEKGHNMPKLQIFEPNYLHMADILFMPMDKGFKYILVVVDTHSKKVDAEPLKNKDSGAVTRAFQKIYARDVLDFPDVIQMDSGGEFKGLTKKYFEDNGVRVKYAIPERHRQQSLVERKNRTIGSVMLKRQTAEELLTKKQSRKWVDDLPDLIKAMNEDAKPITKPISENPIFTKDNKIIIPIGTKVRAKLDYPIDTATGKKLHGNFRASDIKFNPKERRVENVIIKPGYPPLYLLDGKEGRQHNVEMVARTKQQLQVIPENEKPIDPKLIKKKSNQIK